MVSRNKLKLNAICCPSSGIDKAFKNADAIIVLTEWSDYLKIDWSKTSKLMRKPSWVFDTRGIIEEKSLVGTNLNFWKVGKGFITNN